MHYLELEVVEKLLEEEMLVGSKKLLGEYDVDEGLVIWVCSSIEDGKYSLVDGEEVVVSSWDKSINNCFGGMMLIFGLLEALEIEALVDARDVDNG
ncbi:hypothetical protein Tco_1166797 [Tanacetum coccineum]